MKQQRQENAENLDEQQIRDMMNVGNRVVENFVAAHRLRVRKHVHEKKRAQRHNARQLMQFPHHETSADFDSHNEISNFRFQIV